MNHAKIILECLDRHLSDPVELTLYGRAALALGFRRVPEDYALSRDVDAVLWLGQAEQLNETTNFWPAVEQTNEEMADGDLYISHFFEEDQVILQPDWKAHRISLPGDWRFLRLFRLGDLDLLLSKLMRDDPIDHSDALFIVHAAGLDAGSVRRAMGRARVPDSPEIREQFATASARLLSAMATAT